jgi:cobalt-zinc-cadmium efflux system outer membrane protein
VRLAVPLASPPRLLRETAAQRAELAETEAQAALLRERLALDVEAARRELATVERQAAGAADRAALAADTLALLRKSFALGESDLATLLRARSADFDAQAELRRLATARAAAVSRFNQALGVLP